MSFLDGIDYGTDQISGKPELPLTFNLAEWEGKPVLVTRNEQPIQKVLITEPPKVTEQSVVGKVIVPRETFVSCPKKKQRGWDLLTIVIIALAVVLVLQVRIDNKINSLMTLQSHMLFNMFSNNNGVNNRQATPV